MKLVRLELVDYRRHHYTNLEFPDGVVAVVGPNGAGKSTLLEAVGFALFGPKAAGTGKDLIRCETAAPGDTVRVLLEMELAGQAVRVVRELRGRAQAPMASLEVDGHVLVQPIAGSSEQATQQVERMLGLDRDGFFQTVVARQRDLDRLGRLTAGERRRFILDLVGIGAVDEALRVAREKRTALRVQVEEAERGLADQAALTATIETARAEEAAQAKATEDAGVAVTQLDAALTQASKDRDTARARHEERQRLEMQALGLAQQSTLLRTQADAARAEAMRAEEAAARLPTLRAEVGGLSDAPDRLASAQGLVLVRARRLQQQLRLAEQEAVLRAAQAQAVELAVQATAATRGAPDLAALILAAETAHGSLARTEKARAVAGERLAQAKAAAAALADLQGTASCPTCLQPITGDHLAKERAATEARRAAAEESLAAVQRAERDGRTAAEQARQALQAAQAESARVDALVRRREQADLQAASLGATVAALRESLPPDPGPEQDLEDLRRRAAAAQQAQAALTVAEAAAARMAPARTALLAAERSAQAMAAQLAELQLQVAALPDTAATLDQALRAKDAALASLQEARAVHTAALLARQSAQQRLQAAVAERERDRAARTRVAGLRAELARWTALVGAAGGGVLERFREHLVARAAPAINQEASHLLALFTQGRYTELVLDDQYDLYMGDGGRLLPLERFSGGEQDLAHLALRLGISRLLATRSGAPELRFLALDEVFSSLDAERCDALLGALRGLTGLYSQVLAVTHLERLRESFDSVVQVKLADGASLVSVHHG